MALSILESFDEKLPRLPSTFEGEYRRIKPSAITTDNAEAVPTFILEKTKNLVDIARQAIPDPAEGSGQSTNLTSAMPVQEMTHLLATEADVLRAATLYLLHPVNQMLSEILDKGYEVLYESEATANHSRFDIKWTLRYRGHETTMAILELKNTQVICYEDFAPAIATRENAARKLEDAMESDNLTLLQGNAIWLSKQVRKYANFCEDIAIFDWGSMFIFDFDDIDEDSQEPKLVKGTYMEEANTKFCREEGNATFRLLLLGFLVRACERTKPVLS